MERISKWQNKLGLGAWDITTEAISNAQVTYPDDCVGEERFFVGVEYGEMTAVIYHSRPLMEDDIVHELLHIVYPNASHDWIDKETRRLIDG